MEDNIQYQDYDQCDSYETDPEDLSEYDRKILALEKIFELLDFYNLNDPISHLSLVETDDIIYQHCHGNDIHLYEIPYRDEDFSEDILSDFRNLHVQQNDEEFNELNL